MCHSLFGRKLSDTNVNRPQWESDKLLFDIQPQHFCEIRTAAQTGWKKKEKIL